MQKQVKILFSLKVGLSRQKVKRNKKFSSTNIEVKSLIQDSFQKSDEEAIIYLSQLDRSEDGQQK